MSLKSLLIYRCVAWTRGGFRASLIYLLVVNTTRSLEICAICIRRNRPSFTRTLALTKAARSLIHARGSILEKLPNRLEARALVFAQILRRSFKSNAVGFTLRLARLVPLGCQRSLNMINRRGVCALICTRPRGLVRCLVHQ